MKEGCIVETHKTFSFNLPCISIKFQTILSPLRSKELKGFNKHEARTARGSLVVAVGIRTQHCLVVKENIQISAPSTVASVPPSDVLSTVRTEDVVSLCEEASPHQGQGALLTVKAVVVPLAFLKRDILCATQTTNGVGAPSTLLGIQFTEAGQAVWKLIPCCEALPRELLLASCAHEALLVPGLLPVSNTSCGDRLFALHALQGVLLLIAGHAEVLVLLGYEALGADGLLAAPTGEAGLVPAAALIFHLAGTWHDGLLALLALGRVFVGVAVGTQQLLLLGGKRLVHQRAPTPGAVEAAFMPVPILVGQVLAVTANGCSTLLTGVGIQLLEAGHTVWALLLQNVLFAIQRLTAVVAVKAFSHADTCLSATLMPAAQF